MNYVLAVDVGGTQIRVAAYKDGNKEPTLINKISTRGEGSVFERLCNNIRSTWPKDGKVNRIVIALPGPLDPSTGILFSAPNVPEWKNFPIGPEIEKIFGVKTLIGNDANLAALGEWQFGAGVGHKDVLFFTVSTGIGSGIISDNKLIVGNRGLAGELGHIVLDPDGLPCSCGQRGHLESYAAGWAIAAYAKDQLIKGRKSSLSGLSEFSAKEISAEAHKGDELSIEAIQRAGKYLGTAMVNFVHSFNPSILIFGGGVSQNGELLFQPIRDALKNGVMDQTYLRDLKISNAALGDNAGLMGAHALGLLPDQ